jgi:hypothetical protein
MCCRSVEAANASQQSKICYGPVAVAVLAPAAQQLRQVPALVVPDCTNAVSQVALPLQVQAVLVVWTTLQDVLQSLTQPVLSTHVTHTRLQVTYPAHARNHRTVAISVPFGSGQAMNCDYVWYVSDYAFGRCRCYLSYAVSGRMVKGQPFGC